MGRKSIEDLKVGDIRTTYPSTIRLTGKGNKRRIVHIDFVIVFGIM
ncbi:MAG: hypothetical protein GXP56_05510 [Deltaproteobacteria bacterium]|nr:hypothetical protein [Deltaproteobacteria bacterium]